MRFVTKHTMITAALAALLAAVTTTSVMADEQRAPWTDQMFGDGKREVDVAGVFDYYTLVLSWSPTYCATAQRPDTSQCQRRDGRRFSFVLHGLWPQYEKGYPANCRLRRRPFVPDETISSMMDIMPSRGLIIHEYRKHGTCSGLTPEGYYQLSRQLFKKIRVPKKYQNPFETIYTTPEEVQEAFLAANPGLPSGAIAVSCGRGNRAQLREVRICFNRNGEVRNCGANEDARRLCRARQVYLPPVRSQADQYGASGAQTGRHDDSKPRELPRPRLIEGLRGL